ncbi:MAG: DUF805 domain-containing protein, partial [Telluria sp.]
VGLVGVLAAVLTPANKFLGLALLALGMPAALWFIIRLMVLRMHDVNLSGKWLAGAIGLMLLAGVLRNDKMLIAIFAIFWLASFIIYCFVPGTDGENDYGDMPGPNSTLVKVGAGLFILMQAGQLGAAGSGRLNDRLPFSSLRSNSAPLKAETAFSPPDKAFTVMLPGVPTEIPLPPGVAQQLGEVDLRRYQLTAAGYVYTLQSIDYGDRMPTDRYDTMDTIQASLRAPDGALMEASPVVINGNSGRQVKVATSTGGMRAGRFAFAGTRILVVSIEVPDAVNGAPAVDAFLTSFTIN